MESLDEIESANVDITFEPPWEPSMMHQEARKKLGFDKPNKEKNEKKIDWE